MRTDVRLPSVPGEPTSEDWEVLLEDIDLDGLIASMTVECAGGCGASFVPRSRSQRTCGSSRCRMRLLRARRTDRSQDPPSQR